MEIRDKAFLVTGAGSGLGAAVARLLAERGAHLLIADINEAAGRTVADELGDAARFVRTDVGDEASVAAAVEAAVEHFGALHGALSCAGIGIAEKLLGKQGVHSLQSFQRTLQVNLVGTFNVLRLAAQALARNEPAADGERGVIVNTASIAAFEGQIGQVAYSASKAAIVGMTLPAARDLAPLGIRVVTIAPGIFDTPLLGALPEAARVSLGQSIPFPPRLGRPSEFAALAAHIVENTMLNGEVIRLDGALRMAAR